jgi:hypothetical protein
MARIGAQLVFVWQFSQGVLSAPCGLRRGCRWAAAGRTSAGTKTNSESQRDTWIDPEMIAPKRLNFLSPSDKSGVRNSNLSANIHSTVLTARTWACTYSLFPLIGRLYAGLESGPWQSTQFFGADL